MKKNGALDLILSKSSRLMAKEGFDGCSMRDLARATGMSLAGLYHYFGSKEELLYLINRNGFASLLERAEALERAELDPGERLRAFVSVHVGYFAAHRDEMRVMMLGTKELDSKKGAEIRLLKARYAKIGTRLVTSYLGDSGGRKPKTVERKAYLLFGMMNWLFGWYSPSRHGPRADLADEIFSVFAHGAKRAEGIRRP